MSKANTYDPRAAGRVSCGDTCRVCGSECALTAGHDERHGHGGVGWRHSWPKGAPQNGAAVGPGEDSPGPSATTGSTAGAGGQGAAVDADSAAPAPAPGAGEAITCLFCLAVNGNHEVFCVSVAAEALRAAQQPSRLTIHRAIAPVIRKVAWLELRVVELERLLNESTAREYDPLRFKCHFCGQRDIAGPETERHWEHCPKHPAHARIVELQAKISHGTTDGGPGDIATPVRSTPAEGKVPGNDAEQVAASSASGATDQEPAGRRDLRTPQNTEAPAQAGVGRLADGGGPAQPASTREADGAVPAGYRLADGWEVTSSGLLCWACKPAQRALYLLRDKNTWLILRSSACGDCAVRLGALIPLRPPGEGAQVVQHQPDCEARTREDGRGKCTKDCGAPGEGTVPADLGNGYRPIWGQQAAVPVCSPDCGKMPGHPAGEWCSPACERAGRSLSPPPTGRPANLGGEPRPGGGVRATVLARATKAPKRGGRRG